MSESAAAPAAPRPANEPLRLARLRALGLMGVPPEPLFDGFARLAAAICGTPIGLVTLLDEQRQWFLANSGLPGLHETSREVAFCSHAILDGALFEVPDASADPRFAGNPLVTGEVGIRFYAGVPLELEPGVRMGTVCAIDRVPRALSPEQRHLMTELARTASHALLLRDAGALSMAEQALLDSERKFRALSDSSPFGVFHTDATGACTYTNDRWQQTYGLTLEQSLGDGWSRGLHEDDRAAVFAHWQHTAQSGEEFEMTFRVRHASGELRHVRSRARALNDAAGRVAGYVGVVEDISASVQAERQARQSQELLDRAGRLAGVGGWSVDLRTEEIYWSPQTCRIHDVEPGYRPRMEEAIAFYPEPGRSELRQRIAASVVNGEPYEVELPFVTAKGRALWVRAIGEMEVDNGRTVRMFGAFMDVTRRRQMEVGLAEANSRLRSLYEQTPALLMSLDLHGHVLGVSDRLLERSGWRRMDVVGGPLRRWLQPQADNLARLDALLPQLFSQGRCNSSLLQLSGRDGGRIDVLLSAIVEGDAARGQQRALVVLEDVTETLARTEELRQEQALRQRAQAHAEELNSLLAERSEMLDVLAHEVRQPLNNASAALQNLSTVLAGRGDTSAVEPLRRAQRVIQAVVAGVDNTLAVSSLLTGGAEIALVETDVELLIQIAVADLNSADRDRVRLVRQTTIRTVHVDAGLMRLALRNVLLNALAYSPAGREVELRLAELEAPPALVIDVADRGPGIAPEIRERLFQRGARSPKAGGVRTSHGLGLYIVRRAMALQGGQAMLLRTGPEGTVMRLLISDSV